MTEPNDKGVSSASPTDTVQSDVTATPVAKESSGTPTTPEDKQDETSLLDAITDAIGKPEGNTSGPDHEEEQAESESEEPEDEGEDGEDDPVKAEPKVEDEKLPFHTHPRWQEVQKQKREAEAKAAELQPKAEQFVKIDSYLRESNLDDADFVRGLEVMRLIRNDPESALKELDAIRANLSSFLGETLPDDLAAEVGDGLMPEDRARELAKTRAQAKAAREEAEKAQANTHQQALIRAQQEMLSVVEQWEQKQSANDPDWSKKSKFVESEVRAMVASKPPRNSKEVLAIVEQAAANVTNHLKSILPAPTPKRATRSTGSSITSQPPRNETFAQAVRRGIETANA